MTDFVAQFEEFELIIVTVAIAAILYWQRSRVLSVLTGDDRVHADAFDGVWYACCRCCGCCTGAWTRYISCFPCWEPCGLQHQNLVDAFGRWSGLLQWEIRITNIRVGDLPVERAASFFVSFEVGEDHPVTTAVTHTMPPKYIEFHGESVIKVRDTGLDNDVRIVVKEMNTFGSKSLCECYIRPDHLLEWAAEPEGKTMRFEMKPCNGALQIVPAWLLLTLEKAKPFEDESSPFSKANITITETHMDANAGMSPRKVKKEQAFDSIAHLKKAHVLRNEHGIEIREADEHDAERFQSLQRRHKWGMKLCKLVIATLVVAAVLFRIAVTSCYRDFKKVMVLHMHGIEFPPTDRTRNWVLRRCGYNREVGLADQSRALLQDVYEWKDLIETHNLTEYDNYLFADIDDIGSLPDVPKHIDFQEGGTQRLEVNPTSAACNPRRQDVVRMCYELPVGASEPTFLDGIFTCQPWTCRYRMLLAPASLVAVILLAVAVCIASYCHHSNRRAMRDMHQKLIKEAKVRSQLNPLQHHESFNDNSMCCICGGGSSSREARARQLEAGGLRPQPYLQQGPSGPYPAGVGPQE